MGGIASLLSGNKKKEGRCVCNMAGGSPPSCVGCVAAVSGSVCRGWGRNLELVPNFNFQKIVGM